MITKSSVCNALKEMTLREMIYVMWMIAWNAVMLLALVAWFYLGRNYFFHDPATTVNAALFLFMFAICWLAGLFSSREEEWTFHRFTDVLHVIALLCLQYWLGTVNRMYMHIDWINSIDAILGVALIVSGIIMIVSLIIMVIRD